jgi:polyisoprenoid-binding protein YceI
MGNSAWRMVLLAGWLGLAAGGCATRMQDRRQPLPPIFEPTAGAASGRTTPGAGIALPLTAENTRVTFIGTAGPSSHEGEFERLQGEWTLPTDDPKESRLRVRVETGSLRTKIGLLTKHLRGNDFLDVEQFPTATFVSSRIEPADGPGGATHRVTGEFTIHGVNREVTFPVRIVVTANAATLDGTFTISQTGFGMGAAAEKTKDEVPVTVSIRTARQ